MTDTTTALGLDAIRKRLDAATPGPWTAHPDGLVWSTLIGDPVSGSMLVADAEFIATARTDVRDLLNDIDRLQAELEQTRAVAQVYRHAMVSQHEFAGHLIEGRCEPCSRALDEMDGDLACTQAQHWQHTYSDAVGTYLPQPARATEPVPCDCCYIDGHNRRCGRTATTEIDEAPFGILAVAADCKTRIDSESARLPEVSQ